MGILCIENSLIYKYNWLIISIESWFYRVTGYYAIKPQGWQIYLVTGVWNHRLKGIIAERELVAQGKHETNTAGSSCRELAGLQEHRSVVQHQRELAGLFLNHISLKECFYHRDLDFFLMSGGILLGAVNMVLIKSGIGAMFTLANFLIILYLADKICFDRIQLGAIALSCLGIWFYWQFINPSTYHDTMFNPNGLSIIIFSCFCVVSCYLVYLLSACFHFKIFS